MMWSVLLAICVALFVLIGLVDWITGTHLRVFPLYFVPITAVAYRMSRPYALLTAMVATGVWAIANAFAEDSDLVPVHVQVINTLVMLGAFVLVALLNAQVRAHLRTERESSRTDPLTQLPNRRGFLERADILLAAGRRGRRPITLAYIDLDHFKRVNDEQGHAAGDAALRTAAECLREHTRIGDIVARLGGDEFAVLFPDTTLAQARDVLERLRTAIHAAMREHGWPITASIGGTVFPAGGPDVHAAIAAADATMYAVKQRGRDSVHVDLFSPAAAPAQAGVTAN